MIYNELLKASEKLNIKKNAWVHITCNRNGERRDDQERCSRSGRVRKPARDAIRIKSKCHHIKYISSWNIVTVFGVYEEMKELSRRRRGNARVAMK